MHHRDLFQIAEVELTYRNNVDPKDRITLSTSSAANEVFQAFWDQNRIELLEEFKILLLSRSNSCLGIAEIAVGGTAACIADPKIVFSLALKANASGIILAHNHPSGNLEPSKPDVYLTQQLYQGGKLINIDVLDHLIISRVGFYSMADNGLMPSNNLLNQNNRTLSYV